MPVSWATIAAAPPPPPTLSQRMRDLQAFYATQPKQAILLNALGFHDIPGVTEHIAALIEHTVVIGIDTEAWTKNTDEMTEIGLAVFERKDMLEVHRRKEEWEKQHGKDKNDNEYAHLGAFAEELLSKITFHHLRIVETAHLKTNAEWMKGADGNRFGSSRFVTFAEARSILDSLFSQPIPNPSPSSPLTTCKKPIILLGHAISHDEDNLAKSGLAYNLFRHTTIVSKIDTQPLAKETHTWFDPAAPNNEVGLETLTATLGFKHEDAHTACNDAARTVISAIQMVLPRQCRREKDGAKSMQGVAWGVEKRSRDAVRMDTWGSEKCCTRCGGRDHEEKEGEGQGERRCRVAVHCRACAQFDKEWEGECWTSHVEKYCLHVAEWKAWKRRRDDAVRKRNVVPAGPPLGAHPPSDSDSGVRGYTVGEKDRVALTASEGTAKTFAEGKSGSSSSSSGNGGSARGRVVSAFDAAGYASPARIVSFQSSGRGRGGGRGGRGMGSTRGDSVLNKNRWGGDDWYRITEW
ncbi:Nn.00g084040.m01.CDS01 [Neocucurbitaria sp. VM-36]